jgi:hypothetical protein
VTDWTPRPRRQAAAPLTQGKPCDWCACDDCHGVDARNRDSILLADGSRMCDACWLYPPCGMADDCETFLATGACEHRPKQANGATWEPYESLVSK